MASPPMNHDGSSSPDYDAGHGNRDFGILTVQDGHLQRLFVDEDGSDFDRVGNVRQNNPDKQTY